MNLGKLSKRLRKELQAHPKQVAVLAIACLVACWFWWPLLTKSSKGKSKSVAGMSEVSISVEPVSIKTAAARPWFDVHRMQQGDPLTHSALLVEDIRDPFRLPPAAASSLPEEVGELQAEPAQALSDDPPTVHLKLEGIVRSSSRRLAQINGQTVSEGDEIAVGTQDVDGASESEQFQGKVVAINAADVLVELHGQKLRLRLPPKILGRGDVVKRLREP